MVGNPINDGYGGLLLDGYGGGRVLDGYSSVPPVVSPLRRIVASHFKREKFTGRVPARVAVGPVPVPPVPPRPFALPQRLLRTRATHFPHPHFQGRRQPRFDFYYPGGQNLKPRASQFLVESLTRAAATARVSQFAAESLVKAHAAVRASQFAMEALENSDAPSNVRVSQFVLEALVPYSEIPVVLVYPELIGLAPKIVKRPKFSTGSGTGSSGREVRVGYWATPQWEWDISYDLLRDNNAFAGSTTSDIRTLIGFFLSVSGSLRGFYFKDPDDNQVTGQLLGTGDGVTTVFPFVRTFGLGSYLETENVGGVNTTPGVNIYVNGTLQTTGYSISTLTPVQNYVQFTTPPPSGQLITGDFNFWYYCRFQDDMYEFNKFMHNLWEAQKITIFSLKS